MEAAKEGPEKTKKRIENQPGLSRHQTVQSTKKRKRELIKVYKRNLSLEKKIQKANFRAERYRLRSVRLKENLIRKGEIETPRSKTRRLLRHSSSVYDKRALDIHCVLIGQVEHSYKQINVISLVESLKKLTAIETTNLESLVKETVCSVDEKECMYGNCNICKDMNVKLNIKNQITNDLGAMENNKC
ncbi:unnamed protein product [Mytilus coruscus]|uniref:Uncharacterized protein n=1 Tax=Mytilus coruscus TaxID=42192 RepID=A0A6J7ZYT4_MYTCO|nr:unnamed protein product [Mytilus coruscus]